MKIKRLMEGHYYIEGTRITIKSYGKEWQVFDADSCLSCHLVATAPKLATAKQIALEYAEKKSS